MSNPLRPICPVCDEAIEPHCQTTCTGCGKLFHLNQRTDLPGRDCGDVWVNDVHLGLEFNCWTCLRLAKNGALEDVIDLGEAAIALDIDEAAIARAAESGLLPHRKTASGVFLFIRRDLLAFGNGPPS